MPKGYLILLGVISLATVPFAFVGSATRSWFGLPLWLWSSLLFTVVLSIVVAWGVLRLWRDDSGE